MQTRTKLVWLELIGGLLGWIWIVASLVFAYFLVVAAVGGASWSRVGWALGVGAVAKWLARGLNGHKVRVGFTADPGASGYTAQTAGEDWYARYIGRRRSNAASVPLTNAEAIKISSAYGTLLTDRHTSFGDVSALPHEKERIKEALTHRIRVGKDPKERELLRAAYVMLADFQPGFGNPRSAELTADDLRDPSKATARFLAKGDDLTTVSREVAAEAELLIADLIALDFPAKPIERDHVPVRSTVTLVSQ
jgi:hypothetical protein